MKKALCILAKVLAIGLAAAAVFLIVYAFITWPVYPAFQKEVDSYEDLCAPFRESDFIFLPEEDGIPTTYMSLWLSDRTRVAKPTSYVITKQDDSNGISVRYSIDCGVGDLFTVDTIDSTREYRGVGYELITGTVPDATGTTDRYVSLRFAFEGAYYDLHADYDGRPLSEAEIEETNERAAAQLETYAKQVIDQYRRKTPE